MGVRAKVIRRDGSEAPAQPTLATRLAEAEERLAALERAMTVVVSALNLDDDDAEEGAGERKETDLLDPTDEVTYGSQ